MLITGASDDEETSEAQRGDVAGAVPAADERKRTSAYRLAV